jgi:hypothetical protein
LRHIPGNYFNQTARKGWVSTKTSNTTVGAAPDELERDYRQGSTFLKLFLISGASATTAIGEILHTFQISFRTPKPVVSV